MGRANKKDPSRMREVCAPDVLLLLSGAPADNDYGLLHGAECCTPWYRKTRGLGAGKAEPGSGSWTDPVYGERP